jgi:Leucine-rich repeat (LRR) protein
MANQGITALTGFSKFMNLEVLWLNGNNLTEVVNIPNSRIKHIYLQDNKIRTLKGSLEGMKHLESIVVYNNELRDLDKNLEDLLIYPYLTELGIR